MLKRHVENKIFIASAGRGSGWNVFKKILLATRSLAALIKEKNPARNFYPSGLIEKVSMTKPTFTILITTY